VKRGLFLKYMTLFVGLVTGVLVINAALDLYFVYQDNRRASIEVQREKAESAAHQIEAFVRGIEGQIGWVAHPQWASLPVDQRRFDYVRLLRQVPAITELVQLDRQGREQLRVSRVSIDVVGAGTDRSQDPAFVEAMANKVYFGPVYFRKESEPYLTMAVAHGGKSGVTIADVNLKLIWDVVSQIKIGHDGYAYVVDRLGRLVAHPDISLVLRGTDMSRLAQVAAALAPTSSDAAPADATNRAGVPVLSAHASIPALDWLVFVELPLSEAREPVIAAGLRALALLVLGLLIAGLAAALLARRMVVPIRALQSGAQRIGGGELGHRLSIRTGDELEALADQFNRSAEALEESYATLEQRVEDRTRELSETLEQQTATAGILQVISSSPTDVQPVFDAIAESAMRLLNGWSIVVWRYDGRHLHVGSIRGGLPGANETLRRQFDDLPPEELSFVGDAIRDRAVRQIGDVENEDVPAAIREMARQRGWRANVAVPMLSEGRPIGLFSLSRAAPGAFSEREIRLLQTFADQAVIAFQNVQLFTDLRESLEQQTATAEILRVISQSPTDVRPVLDVVVRAARRFCGADDAMIVLREGTEQLLATHQGSLPALVGNRFPLDRSSTTGRATIDGCTIHVPDVADLDPVEDALTLELTRRTNVRALLAAPMLREGMAVGCVLLRKPMPGAFTPRQIELLETFAAQAVIAIENVRLFTELRESLDQQTATAEILGVINSSPGDVAPVFDAILGKAMLLCDAAFGLFNTYDGKRFHTTTTRGVPEAFAEYRNAHPADYGPGSSPAQLIAGAPYVHTIDAADGAAYKAGEPNRRALVDLGGARSLLVMSLRKDGALLGMIGLYRQEVRPFTDKQIALLQGFAAQAVIAMENARLLTEQREALEQQTATAEVLRVISQSPTDVQPVLDAVVAAARRFCGADDAVIILRDGQEMVLVAHEGSLKGRIGRRNPLDRSSINGRATIDGRTIHIPDVAALDPAEFATAQRLAAENGIRAFLAAPMMRAEGGAVGCVLLRTPVPGSFTPRQIELLETFAAQAVIAIENVRLFTEIQEKGRQLEVASQHKSQFLANMSHELRTPLNAIIGYTEMMADGLYGDVPEKAQGVLERVQSNGRHLLGLINDVLDLSKIEAGQLALAIEEYSVADMVGTVIAATESLARTKGLALTSAVAPGLPTGHGDARRLSQVLLNLVGNAIKFTDQGGVEIRAVQANDRFELSVIDSGLGISPADQARIFDEFQQVDNTSTRKKGGTGLGLSISRRIVELHGGTITVQSEVGTGSIFKVTVPVNADPIKEAAQ
jgi:signal transduction histidine kinase